MGSAAAAAAGATSVEFGGITAVAESRERWRTARLKQGRAVSLELHIKIAIWMKEDVEVSGEGSIMQEQACMTGAPRELRDEYHDCET